MKLGVQGQQRSCFAGAVGANQALTEPPGVPELDRQRIFHRFERLARERERAVAGAGIGLSVVLDLVSRHGGGCFVEPAEGCGARFVVELPAAIGARAEEVRA